MLLVPLWDISLSPSAVLFWPFKQLKIFFNLGHLLWGTILYLFPFISWFMGQNSGRSWLGDLSADSSKLSWWISRSGGARQLHAHRGYPEGGDCKAGFSWDRWQKCLHVASLVCLPQISCFSYMLAQGIQREYSRNKQVNRPQLLILTISRRFFFFKFLKYPSIVSCSLQILQSLPLIC